MHHRTVRGVAIFVWSLITAAAAVFGWNAGRVGSPPPAAAGPVGLLVEAGRTAFAARCASCHRCTDVAATEQDASGLLARLARHGAGSLQEDLAIVGFLTYPGACNEDGTVTRPRGAASGTGAARVAPR